MLLLNSLGVVGLCQSSELTRLQQDYAIRYFEPEPHMALVKYFLKHDDRREAFITLEAARRSILEEKVFNHAFQVAFEGFDNSKSAEDKLLSELAANPHSADIQFQLADIYISREDYTSAKPILAKGIAEHPEDFRFVYGLAEILRTEGKTRDGDRLVDEFVKKYPDSPEAFESRAQAVHDSDRLKAKQLLEEAVSKYPNDGNLLFRLAAVIQETGDLDKAEADFVKAASLAPKSVNIQSWVGRFFFKVRNNGERALPFYFSAYFLSPHAYETEFVESRIRSILLDQARADFDSQLKAQKPSVELLKDPNPLVVALALNDIEKNWKPDYLPILVDLMGHEDGGVRWDATELLKKKIDRSFDPTLRNLLKDTDLRTRGLAAYLAVHLWKTDSFEMIKRMLLEEAELIRFDAISALILEGGEAGRRIALAHAQLEKHPRLKLMLENERTQKPSRQNHALPKRTKGNRAGARFPFMP